MKKRRITITIFSISLIISVISFNLNKEPQLDLGYLFENAEAIASGEQGNPWESNYQYCRCKKDNTGKGCYGGNAISTHPSCYKYPIGTTFNCRTEDSKCR